MALVVLSKFHKRPFTMQKAFRWWSKDWMILLKTIIYNIAYGTSINEQIGFWRWKRVLMPKTRKPLVIEIREA
jgi:hypothetical protein